jgi:signal transduction histidine kinase
MTLQRVPQDDTAPAAVSRTVLRAKPLTTSERLRALALRDRREGRDLDDDTAEAAPRDTGTFETLLSELTRMLTISFDYTAALQDLTRIVAARLDCGCVVDLLEPHGHVQLASVAEHAAAISSESIAPLVSDVVARRRTAAAAVDASALDGRRSRPIAERALHETGTPWIVCAPIATPDGEALGALTLFGGIAGSYVPRQLAREIGQRAAVAIKNGRLYASALLAAKERQRVLSLVAHELKNPLGVILMGTVQALEAVGADGGGRAQKRELEAIHRSAKRMKKLVGDLLDLASIDAGKLSVKPTACDVPSVIASALADVSTCAAAAGVEITSERMPGVPAAWADGDRLGQVLVNLVSNAVKFTPRGGRVRVRCAPVDRTEIVVAVEDSGRGIAPGDLHRIFDHFWQAADTAELGSGLGLAICKAIIELSGGRIWAQSTVGVGTTVYFTLPAHGA